MVGCFGFSGPLRQYFSLYQAVSRREGEREERIEERKNVQTTPTRTYCNRNRPLTYYHPNCRTPRHWKFSQDHRITRPPPTDGQTDGSILICLPKFLRGHTKKGDNELFDLSKKIGICLAALHDCNFEIRFRLLILIFNVIIHCNQFTLMEIRTITVDVDM